MALEDPGWHAQRLIVEEAGLEVTPVAVDCEGISVADLNASGAEVVIVTPAHQFPTGVVLSPRRRAQLIEWAERGDRLIIEDDYDAELCRGQIGALQGLAPDRVLYERALPLDTFTRSGLTLSEAGRTLRTGVRPPMSSEAGRPWSSCRAAPPAYRPSSLS